jgi:hypothetical protein
MGEAMPVFEAEQGMHPIILAQLNTGINFEEKSAGNASAFQGKIKEIKKRLTEFIRMHRDHMQTRCEMVRHALGIDYISIEGYFDQMRPEFVEVVDLDLPMDVAFTEKAQ